MRVRDLRPYPDLPRGVLYLTNIHRLYEERQPRQQNPVAALVGPSVKKDMDAVSAEELFGRIAMHERLLVVDDEAHHVHDPKLEWWKTIERLDDACDEGVVAQLDFSATPKDQTGQLFREIVVDYPLAQAVEDGIVKVPVIGEIGGPVEIPATNAAERYRQWVEAGAARWRRFRGELAPVGKKPILFLMAEDTQSADEIGDYLRLLPEFKGDQTLVIHTDRRGDIKKQELEKARAAAREVDADDSDRESPDAARGVGREERLRDRRAA